MMVAASGRWGIVTHLVSEAIIARLPGRRHEGVVVRLVGVIAWLVGTRCGSSVGGQESVVL